LWEAGWGGAEGGGGCWGGVDVVADEVGDCGWGDVVDEGEGGEEEDGCWSGGGGVVVVVIGEGQVGGGEHEFLDWHLALEPSILMDAEDVHAQARSHIL